MPALTTLTTPDGTTLAYADEKPPAATVPDPSLTSDAADAAVPRPPVLLLHGLAGHLGEWDDLSARLLADGHRVVRHDARGHGASTRAPADMTRAAAVRDTVSLMDALALPPAILLGQSLGGLTALLTAAAHPSRVAALILVEAGPQGRNPQLPAQIGAWLDSWPTPFTSFGQASAFLGHEAWARGLDWREDGTGHARVDRDTMVAAVAELATQDYWEQWSRVTCPTLVVRGERGTMPAAEHTEMRTRRPSATRLTVVPQAGHDVHLDRPTALHEAVTAFLAAGRE
ncbi:alpha/beta fold hydrolase [Streptomyces sp. SAS_272]|uniref:alpha/beta fold hydrolase n=1 Tax=Streptomyces sp. SAS_272 TaxID=3412747 RepID=UPI00403C3464